MNPTAAPQYSLTYIPTDPDAQVAATIAVMQQYAREDSGSPQIRAEAQDAMQYDAAKYGAADPIRAIWEYVRGRMTFVRDEVTAAAYQPYADDVIVEAITRPRDMNTRRQGDCDDYATYAAALLMSLGVDVAFATVAADPADPAAYSHVYLVAYVNGVRVPLDFSHGKQVGWEVENTYGKFREWGVGGGGVGSMLIAAAVAAWWLLRGRRER